MVLRRPFIFMIIDRERTAGQGSMEKITAHNSGRERRLTGKGPVVPKGCSTYCSTYYFFDNGTAYRFLGLVIIFYSDQLSKPSFGFSLLSVNF